ncbi:2-dehydro-3-deoxy-6-phosphogalactonate aldolase [soil metagenome]
MPMGADLQSYLDRLPLIAILRGVRPDEVVAIGEALVDAGVAIIEVPLNSPDALDSIRRLHDAFGVDVLLGAGTVMTPSDTRDVAAAGGRLVVMPHSDADVIRAATAEGLTCIPGIATPTEGFRALANGADGLKLFPAELLTPTVLRAFRAVFPTDTKFFPVGGITPGSMGEYVAAGATGFGLGSALYRPGDSPAQVSIGANDFATAWSALPRA